jgi:predicted nucleic acid-binding protein
MKDLLDTNVLREIGKTNPPEHVAAWIASVDDADVAISALTVREVTKGIARLRKSKPEIADLIAERMAEAFDSFDERIVAVDRAVAEDWGELLAASERHVDDAGLAATAAFTIS